MKKKRLKYRVVLQDRIIATLQQLLSKAYFEIDYLKESNPTGAKTATELGVPISPRSDEPTEPEPAFKVGDRVRVIARNGVAVEETGKEGVIFDVIQDLLESLLSVRLDDGEELAFPASMLEKIEEPEPLEMPEDAKAELEEIRAMTSEAKQPCFMRHCANLTAVTYKGYPLCDFHLAVFSGKTGCNGV